ncbi:hypothetical protein [Paenibacillus elgii]|uniref:hypothetical protein n=1 Tax=Paenibacillus elgii TaxID=189691 RepID=UPI000248C9AC|nr:hypothetical protein [Paenibacillus elgii]
MSIVNQLRNTFMSRYGLTEDIIHKETIDVAGPDPVYFSADPNVPSVVEPIFVTINSIDEFKEFGGNPDHLYENGTLEERYEVPPPWPESRTSLPYEELTAQEQSAICKAYTAYIEDNSKKVQSYKEVIQKHFFPTELAILAANDLIVRNGQTVNLQGGSSEPVTFSYNTITIEPGGRINATGKVKILSNIFTQQPGDGSNPTITNEGQDGTSGAAGSNGGNGAGGSKGSSGTSGKNSCDTQPGKGGAGQPGKPGGNGGNGGTVNIIYSSAAPGTSFQFTPNPNKGKAGQGGRGGNGGSGGQGSPTGSGGNGGHVGSNGTTGTPGKIYVNNVLIN